MRAGGMTKKAAACVGALTLGALSLGACAGRPPPPPQDGPPDAPAAAPSVVLSGDALAFVSFDADGDYRVTRDEAVQGVAREWALFGADALSPIQFQRWSALALGGPAMGPYRLEFDRNVDGQITRDEFEAAFLTRFDAYDRDGDGVVTRADMLRVLPRPAMQRPPRMPRMPPGGPPGGMRPPGG